MLEAEISPSGAVLVEGHHVGELQAFRFTADQTADGEDAKAVRAAAQKALAQEFETRAERFANAGNNDIALGSDGVLRWIGSPVATLTATDDPLKPRAILLADEQLTGPARDKVAARAERFVAYQIETLLKPLVDLKAADQLTGMARGIAFRLVENFGLVNRRDIAEDVRSLDQEARAALRRLGVRFGAYHVFIPTLIKPAPAGLITLLWALANDGKDKPGFGDVVNALATGRTSVVVDPTFEGEFYRLAGYRNLGRRAVRVDILERLADLIRPAMSWKDGAGARPDGAYGGSAFVVTPPMMSILGATAEDMEEILKGLGYRAEPKSAEGVESRLAGFDAAVREKAAAQATEAAAASQAAAGMGEAGLETSDGAVNEAVHLAGSPETVPAAGETEATAVEPAPQDTEAAPATEAHAAPGETNAETQSADGDAAAPSTAADNATPAATEAPMSAEAEAPRAPVLVWRQGRAEGRPQHHRGNRGRHGQPQQGQGAADGESRPERDGKRRFDRKFGGKPGGQGRDRNAPDGAHPDGGNRGDRQRENRHGKPRNDRPQRDHQPPRQREERPARIDPDSPFAKLAALRDQLKK